MNDWFEALPDSVLHTIAGLFAFLALATVLVYGVIPRLKPAQDHHELQLRTRSWWLMLAFLTAAIIGPVPVKLPLLAFLCFLALREFFAIVPVRGSDRRLLWWAYLVIPAHFAFIWGEWHTMFLIFIPVFAFLFFPLRMVVIGETKGFLAAAATLQWGVMLNVFCLSHLAKILMLPATAGGLSGGAGLGLYLLMLTELNDVAQFTWGKLLGRHKVIPRVSPKKTVEGLLGGIATTVTLSLLLREALTPMSFNHAIVAGLVISVCGFVGDVVVSAIKRDLGIKDSGTTIPGHGGVLDRLDSLTYTAPLFFHFIYYFYY